MHSPSQTRARNSFDALNPDIVVLSSSNADAARYRPYDEACICTTPSEKQLKFRFATNIIVFLSGRRKIKQGHFDKQTRVLYDVFIGILKQTL